MWAGEVLGIYLDETGVDVMTEGICSLCAELDPVIVVCNIHPQTYTQQALDNTSVGGKQNGIFVYRQDTLQRLYEESSVLKLGLLLY